MAKLKIDDDGLNVYRGSMKGTCGRHIHIGSDAKVPKRSTADVMIGERPVIGTSVQCPSCGLNEPADVIDVDCNPGDIASLDPPFPMTDEMGPVRLTDCELWLHHPV